MLGALNPFDPKTLKADIPECLSVLDHTQGVFLSALDRYNEAISFSHHFAPV